MVSEHGRDGHQVLAGRFQPPLGPPLLLLVAGDARRLADQEPSLLGRLGRGVNQAADLLPLDDGVVAGAHARLDEKAGHVLEAPRRAVYQVPALPVPVEAPGDGHLRLAPVGIVVPGQGQGHLGQSGGRAALKVSWHTVSAIYLVWLK